MNLRKPLGHLSITIVVGYLCMNIWVDQKIEKTKNDEAEEERHLGDPVEAVHEGWGEFEAVGGLGDCPLTIPILLRPILSAYRRRRPISLNWDLGEGVGRH